MRSVWTTVDLEERALTAARAKAAVEGISLGRAISELIEAGLSGPGAPIGFPMFPETAGHVITDELVAAHRDVLVASCAVTVIST